MAASAAILASALLAALLAASPAAAIDGGARVGRADRVGRAAVAIGTVTAGEDRIGFSRCTGVLIAPTLVLTAAHCVQGNPVASAVIAYDGYRPKRPIVPVAALELREPISNDLPDEYAAVGDLALDTAVLRLSRPVRGHAPIRVGRGGLPTGGLRLVGAGLSAEGIGTLKTTHLVPLVASSRGLLIARTNGSAICRGDSGGPVVADGPRGPVLYGVASAVITNAPPCGTVVVVAPARPAE